MCNKSLTNGEYNIICILTINAVTVISKLALLMVWNVNSYWIMYIELHGMPPIIHNSQTYMVISTRWYSANQLHTVLALSCICYNSLECEDYLCRNPEHIYNLDSLCNALIDICIKASDRTFPMRSPPSGRLPMWNERVRPLRDTSLFWHNVWKSA